MVQTSQTNEVDMLLTVAVPVQLPEMQFFDKQGKPLVGGKIYSHKVGTGEFKPTFKNAQKTALNRNPVVLDNAGCAFIYLNGNHHLKIFDKNDRFIEERWVPSTEFKTFFFDKFGKALRFGKVYTHDFESTVLKPSYQNPEKTVRNTNPVILDEDGSAMMCMNGSYRLRVYDEKGVFQGDQDFFRNVAYALTSKPYPVYLDEDLSTNFEMNHIDFTKIHWHESELIEKSKIDLIVHDVYMYDSSPIPYLEVMSVGFSVNNVLLSQTPKLNLTEDVCVNFIFNNVLRHSPVDNYHTETTAIDLTVNNVIVEYL